MQSRVIIIFAVLTAIWGASFLWIKIAVLDIGAFSLVAWRLAFAVVGLLPIVAVRRPEWPRGAKTWWAIVVVGVLSTTMPWLLISWAEKSIDSALATVLNSMVPMFTLVIAHFALHDDRMTLWRVAGLLLGFTGVLVLTRSAAGGEGPEPGSKLLGVLAMLGGGLCYSVGTIIVRRSLRHMSSLALAFYTVVVSAVLTWIVVPLMFGGVNVPTAAMVWGAIAWLGVLGAGLASYLFFYLLQQVGPTRASLITYLIPPIGVFLGVVVLDEPLDVFLIAGSMLIVSGLWVVNRK